MTQSSFSLLSESCEASCDSLPSGPRLAAPPEGSSELQDLAPPKTEGGKKEMVAELSVSLLTADASPILKNILDSLPQCIFWKDRASIYQGCNRAFADVVGVSSPAEVKGKSDDDMPWTKDEADRFRVCDRRIMSSKTPAYGIIESQRQRDGRQRWIKIDKIPLRDESGAVVGILGSYEDVSDRISLDQSFEHQTRSLEAAVLEATKALRASQEQLHHLAANLPGMIYQFRRTLAGEMSFPYVSSGCQELCEVAPADAMADAQVLFDIIEPKDIQAFRQAITESAQHLTPWQWEGRVVLNSGQEKWLQGGARPTRQADGSVLWDGLLIDVSDRKRAEQQLQRLNRELEERVEERTQALALANQELEHLANLDGLTQIANRRRFDQCLYQEWRRLAREHQCLSLILIDIDHFKTYNDRYGHLAGDQCLHRVAQMLQSMVMRPADLVSRYGGEEFAVILPSTPIAGAEAIAKRIQEGMATLRINHDRSPTAIYVTLSLGIATTVPNTKTLPTTLIEYADTALYEAKAKGRNRYRQQLF